MCKNDETRMSMIRRGGTNDEMESALEGLAPKPLAIDRDQLMYQAGFAAAARRDSFAPAIWKASTAVMTAATVALAVMLARGPNTGGATASVIDPPRRAVGSVAPNVANTQPAPPTAEAVAPREIAEPHFWTPPRRSPARFGDPTKNYLALRAITLERGIDAWPVSTYDYDSDFDDIERRPTTARELLKEMLPKSERRVVPDNQLPVGVSPTEKESFA